MSRSVEGVVRVVQDRQIVTFDGTVWWSKPDVHEYAAFVSSALRNVPTELAEHILDFCVHVAGPGVAGATLIWCRPARGDHPRPRRGRHRSAAARSALVCRRQVASTDLAPARAHRRRVPPELVRTPHSGRPPPARHPALRSSPSKCGPIVAPDTPPRSDVPSTFPARVVFVISEDGPVTVFAGGQVVASINTPVVEAGQRTL